MAQQTPITGTPETTNASRAACLRDDLLLRIARRALADINGRIALTLPSGRAAVIGRGTAVDATLSLRDFSMLWNSVRRGTIGFADSYMEGGFETRDLRDLFALFIDNRARLTRKAGQVFRGRGAELRFHRARANTPEGSRRNIAAHYDLGNDFYRHWLDAGMTYSSALYAGGSTTLEAAQAAKYDAIMRALDVPAGADVLEIGCGWGALAETLGRAGAKVRAITVSAAQLAWARQRIASAGLGETVEACFEDYRDTTGVYDRIVSVEMIEAVGEEHWPAYFNTIAARLKSGGSAVLQAITIREESFPGYARRPDFIQRYIFPGGMLPTKSHIAEHARRAGLGCETVLLFGDSYARTLADWRTRFEAAWPQIAALGFDERFRRMWRYYLCYCEAGFAKGVIDVGLYRLTKPA